MRGAAAAAAASGYEFDDGAFDGGDGGGNAVGGNDEGPKVSIVNRVDGLLAG